MKVTAKDKVEKARKDNHEDVNVQAQPFGAALGTTSLAKSLTEVK